MSDWCTIESDPGVFQDLISSIGVKGIGVEEIYSLEDDYLLQSIQPIHGLIFLFKWEKEVEKRECLKFYDNDLFFANQVITNACATQAILSVILNTKNLEIGEELNNFKSFTEQLDSQTKGLALSNSDVIRQVHNSFARPEPFVFTEKKRAAKKGDEVYHFISYIPFKGKVYELDGLQEGPILLGEYTNEVDWIEVAKIEIQKRIEKYAANEIGFNLMAICQNKEVQATQDLRQQSLRLYKALITLKGKEGSQLNQLQEAQLNELSKEFNENDLKAGESFQNNTIEQLNQQILSIQHEIERQRAIIADEQRKMAYYKVENARRRHNYIPFIVELLKLSAKKGVLSNLVETARQKKKEKSQQSQQLKKEENK